ncbi:hypothetical protein [Burkholderia alba]|uniref:hypothetical protein n=1 Tax=Burkholderia alba TaxID=2683677 RepID=UPI002B05DCF9|nr:hypothetical protein [Burkholderia alba]
MGIVNSVTTGANIGGMLAGGANTAGGTAQVLGDISSQTNSQSLIMEATAKAQTQMAMENAKVNAASAVANSITSATSGLKDIAKNQ